MHFFRRAPGRPQRLGVFPGTFNPPTRAHLAIARAALASTDEVLFVLPRVFPHKLYEGASFDERIDLLSDATADEPRFSIASSEGGLFAEIAQECRSVYPSEASLAFICGRDAAERIANWDYGDPDAFRRMLRDWELLVASRQGEYMPPQSLRLRIHALAEQENCDAISASEVRDRIHAGQPWRHLVPESIAEKIQLIYG